MLTFVLAVFLAAQEAAPLDPAPVSETDEPVVETAVSQVALALLADLPATLEEFAPEGRAQAMAVRNFAMAGREDLAARIQPGLYERPPCPLVREEGMTAVGDAARDAQIVIINESHNQPQHRHTVTQLGAALSEGFDVFAAQTFNHVRLSMEAQTGPLGWHDREPIFARQVAALRDGGYRFVAYEIRMNQRDASITDRVERAAMREEAQAENLIAQVLDAEPDARILVHVGHSHLFEAPQDRGEDQDPILWFAARLKAKTGIDPLTISQTHCSLAPIEASSSHGVSEEAATVPAAETDLGWPVLVDGAGVAPEDAVDLFLAHPPMRFTDLRPDWRRTAGDVALDIPDALRPSDAPVIVEARPPGTSLEAMPADRVLLYPGEIAPVLVPPGQWVLTAWTANGAYANPVEMSTP